ncbi:pancreatic lipase-related protein 2-like isoform 2-T2 [Leptodactylus fuscus]
MMKTWQDQLGYPPSNVHIIGHSLGAHAAGEAGKRFPGVRRITGLDPARPMFEDTPEEVRLDRSDADLVDVIHTDTKPITGLGIIKPIGHMDFYPNGGDHMAGCPSKLTILINSKDSFNILACNHFRSFIYFTYSVSHSDAFISYPCESYTAFTAGSCFPCAPGGCPSMGYYADSSHNTTNWNQSFYLNTGEDINELSRWRYKISVLLRGTGRRLGKLYVGVAFPVSGGNETFYRVSRGLLVPGDTYSIFVDSGVKLHAALNVTFHWTSLTNLFKIQLGADRIEIQAGEDGSIFSFCSNEMVLDSEAHYLDPC